MAVVEREAAAFRDGAAMGSLLPPPCEVTPTSITTTAGGDPSTGGALAPTAGQGDRASIVFTPLAPPRMPPKDAPQGQP